MSRRYFVEMKLGNGEWFPLSKLDSEAPARERMEEVKSLLSHREVQLVKVETIRTVLEE